MNEIDEYETEVVRAVRNCHVWIHLLRQHPWISDDPAVDLATYELRLTALIEWKQQLKNHRRLCQCPQSAPQPEVASQPPAVQSPAQVAQWILAARQRALRAARQS
jgi:hypothetical protein